MSFTLGSNSFSQSQLYFVRGYTERAHIVEQTQTNVTKGSAGAAKPRIKSVYVLSSGSAGLHHEHRYGTKKPLMWWVLTSRSWVKAPINFFVIDHCDGPILFDTGLSPDIVSNPDYISSPIGRFLLKRIFRLDITEDERLDKLLAKVGKDASEIRTAVISHLHFDHVGGIKHLPQADLIISQEEWDQLSEPHPEKEWFLKEHIKIPGAKWKPFQFQESDDPIFEDFEGVFDLAGDGSMVLLPTPGHTPGSISMLIRNADWSPILLVGDLAYESELIDRNVTAGVGDAKELRKTYAKVMKLKAHFPDLKVVPAHDFKASEMIAQAISCLDDK